MPEAKTKPEAGCLFLEAPEFGGAFGYSYAVDKVLFHKKTPFQEIFVVEAGELGRLLILDRATQTCSLDETGYHEMLVHVPMLSHPKPERILVIGGGDGGTLREAGKHPSVEKMDICEIDGDVIETSRKFLPELSCGLDDPRVSIHVADGAAFVARAKAEYDLIFVDSSDPIGPAVVLYTPEFYNNLKQALRPDGIVVSQMESFFAYGELIRRMFSFLPDIFEKTLYYQTLVPTYLSGVIGFAFCSTGPDPLSPPDPARVKALGPLQYYTPAVHRAAFALPQRCLDLLPEKLRAVQSRI